MDCLSLCALAQKNNPVEQKYGTSIAIEINRFRFAYNNPKTNGVKRIIPIDVALVFSGHIPIYKSIGFTPILGLDYYYFHNKTGTGDLYHRQGIIYGFGIEQKIRVSENSNFGIGVQKIFVSTHYEDNVRPSNENYTSDLFRIRLMANTKFYRRFGIMLNCNFVAHSKNGSLSSPLGSFRDVNFVSGFTYNLAKGGNK